MNYPTKNQRSLNRGSSLSLNRGGQNNIKHIVVLSTVPMCIIVAYLIYNKTVNRKIHKHPDDLSAKPKIQDAQTSPRQQKIKTHKNTHSQSHYPAEYVSNKIQESQHTELTHTSHNTHSEEVPQTQSTESMRRQVHSDDAQILSPSPIIYAPQRSEHTDTQSPQHNQDEHIDTQESSHTEVPHNESEVSPTQSTESVHNDENVQSNNIVDDINTQQTHTQNKVRETVSQQFHNVVDTHKPPGSTTPDYNALNQQIKQKWEAYVDSRLESVYKSRDVFLKQTKKLLARERAPSDGDNDYDCDAYIKSLAKRVHCVSAQALQQQDVSVYSADCERVASELIHLLRIHKRDVPLSAMDYIKDLAHIFAANTITLNATQAKKLLETLNVLQDSSEIADLNLSWIDELSKIRLLKQYLPEKSRISAPLAAHSDLNMSNSELDTQKFIYIEHMWGAVKHYADSNYVFLVHEQRQESAITLQSCIIGTHINNDTIALYLCDTYAMYNDMYALMFSKFAMCAKDIIGLSSASVWLNSDVVQENTLVKYVSVNDTSINECNIVIHFGNYNRHTYGHVDLFNRAIHMTQGNSRIHQRFTESIGTTAFLMSEDLCFINSSVSATNASTDYMSYECGIGAAIMKQASEVMCAYASILRARHAGHNAESHTFEDKSEYNDKKVCVFLDTYSDDNAYTNDEERLIFELFAHSLNEAAHTMKLNSLPIQILLVQHNLHDTPASKRVYVSKRVEDHIKVLQSVRENMHTKVYRTIDALRGYLNAHAHLHIPNMSVYDSLAYNLIHNVMFRNTNNVSQGIIYDFSKTDDAVTQLYLDMLETIHTSLQQVPIFSTEELKTLPDAPTTVSRSTMYALSNEDLVATLQGNYSTGTELQSQIEGVHLYSHLQYALLHINAYRLLQHLANDVACSQRAEREHKYIFDTLRDVYKKNAELLLYLESIQEYMHNMRNLEIV